MQIVHTIPEDAKISGEDWDSLMWHNGKLFSGSFANGKVKVWSEDLKPVAEFVAHGYPIYHMTPGQGTNFFTSSSDCTIKHWKEESGEFKLLETLEGHTEPPRRLRFCSGKLFSGDETGIVRIWDGGKCVAKLETMEEIWDLLVSEEELVTVRHVDVTLFSLKRKDDENYRICVKNSVPGRAPILMLESNRLCCMDRNSNAINVHDLGKSGNPQIGNLKGHEAIVNAMLTKESNTLFTGGYDKKVISWNLEKCSLISEVVLDGYVNALAINPEKQLVYAAGENKLIVSIKI